MSIEVYKGKYVTAENANKYIDITTIKDGCAKLVEASKMLENTAEKIEQLKQLCSVETFSIDNNGLEDIIGEYKNSTKNFSKYIDELSDTIQNTAQRVFNRKQISLNAEARRAEQSEIRMRENII